MASDQLLLNALEVEAHSATEQDVQVLERDCGHVRSKQSGERVV
jgi:hypothetical protein